jgi:hypothetical protein
MGSASSLANFPYFLYLVLIAYLGRGSYKSSSQPRGCVAEHRVPPHVFSLAISG